MRYISDDGKVFNTEQECCEHEQKIEAERIVQNELEKQRKEELNKINEKYNELNKLISDYKQKYGDTRINIVNPFSEFARIILGC